MCAKQGDLTAPGGSVASERIDVDEAVIDDAAGLSKVSLKKPTCGKTFPKHDKNSFQHLYFDFS